MSHETKKKTNNFLHHQYRNNLQSAMPFQITPHNEPWCFAFNFISIFVMRIKRINFFPINSTLLENVSQIN
ncbi:CLUMA_CG003351, isoform A [Clunio marinus]|uniref:CLUMA_CG003351, isoform A n=1 Tax=Clunio marinus TaxID=568069 RepID=A0A1J1HND5_9DIPT|nr:CLUMA_CG003351, isoform A [Clunio marinus]